MVSQGSFGYHELDADNGIWQTRPIRITGTDAAVLLKPDTNAKAGTAPVCKVYSCPLTTETDTFWSRDTGSIEIDATTAGATCIYTRQDAGSYITNGFAIGQWVRVTGYATNAGNNGLKRIENLAAGVMTTTGACVAEDEAGGDRIIGALDTDACTLICADGNCDITGDATTNDDAFYQIVAPTVAVSCETAAGTADQRSLLEIIAR